MRNDTGGTSFESACLSNDETIQPMTKIAIVDVHVISKTSRVLFLALCALKILPTGITDTMNPIGQTNLRRTQV